MWNNALNLAVIAWLGRFTMVSAHFNQFVHYISGSNLVKGYPMMAAIWYFWCRDADPGKPTRRIVIGTLAGCFLAVFLARVINNIGAFQPRPVANNALLFPHFAGLPDPASQALYIWNSFPSDHAAMYFSLAAGMFLISRRFGVFAYLYVFLFIALPRMYLGLHYATDIIAGAFLGVACVLLFNGRAVVRLYERPYQSLLDRYPAAFQTVLFLICIELSMTFDDVRELVEGIGKYLH
ncbi:phosphatase PAP2 family protein [Oxalobacteraceae bacterium CAVE-383]|nr:phosphatase PAP2 family protein [Oxalobacteraceae bacterium CAVE-383]